MLFYLSGFREQEVVWQLQKPNNWKYPGKSPASKAWFNAVKESRVAWLYILPSALLMLIITFLPQIYQIWMSFTDYPH